MDFGFIPFIVIVGIIISVINKAKKLPSSMQDDVDVDTAVDLGRIIEEAVRMHNQAQGKETTTSTKRTVTYGPNRTRRTVTETVTSQTAAQTASDPISSEGTSQWAHSPLEHIDGDPDCEAHQKPTSSEGSNVRAHSASSHTAEEKCSAHSAPASHEGETREERLERLRKKKAQMDAQASAQDKKENQPTAQRPIAVKRVQTQGVPLQLGKDSLLQGILYAEILGKPKSLKH